MRPNKHHIAAQQIAELIERMQSPSEPRTIEELKEDGVVKGNVITLCTGPGAPRKKDDRYLKLRRHDNFALSGREAPKKVEETNWKNLASAYRP